MINFTDFKSNTPTTDEGFPQAFCWFAILWFLDVTFLESHFLEYVRNHDHHILSRQKQVRDNKYVDI